MAEGKRVGPYRIFEPLGRGGMGVVYRARHVTSERAVALKTVHSAARWSLDGLRREILALTTVRHPGVVRIVDHGIHDGLPWYAMDLLEGESLRRFGQRIWSPFRAPQESPPQRSVTATDVLSDTVATQQSADFAGQPYPRAEPGRVRPPAAAGELTTVLLLMRRVCATLAFLHGEGFINCDLKPENILLVEDQPVIIDFGLTAHHPGRTGRESLEVLHAMSGTLQYMSPEQIRGELVDARSDLYALGCILYELVVGRPPFAGSPPTLMGQHLAEEAPPPSALVRDVPPGLERTIRKLLAKELKDRFGYADEVAAALAELTGDRQRFSEYPPSRAYLYRPGFVGREPVLGQLVAHRERAVEGPGACVLIGGESGVGKTRLAMELTRVVPANRMRVITSDVARPAPSGADTSAPPLQVLRSLLMTIADECHEGGPLATEQLLGERRALLARYEPLLDQVPISGEEAPMPPLTGIGARQRLFRYLWETIAALTQVRPLLWVIDDLGWADELSLSFLATLTAEYLAEHRLFIVGTYRSEESAAAVAPLIEQAHVIHLLLPRLDADGVRSMVSDMLALEAPPESFMSFVVQQTEGNPFFVAEYLRGAVTDRMLFRDENTWRLPAAQRANGYESLAFPNALRDLVERRLKALSPVAGLVVTAAAVLGREMETETLSEVADLSEPSFVAAWGELLRRQVFEQPHGGVVRFAHDKLRESAYAQASADQLRQLHARAGDALTKAWVGRPDESRGWAALGYHYTAAQQTEKAAHFLRLAGDHARETFANAEAIRLYRQAIDQTQAILLRLPPDPEQWEAVLPQLHEALGDVLSLTAQRDEARIAYQDALRCTGEAQSVRTARLQRKLGKTWEAEHQHDTALACYARALAALVADGAPTAPDTRDEWIQAHIEQLWVFYWLNRVEDMEEVRSRLEPVLRDGASSSQRARFFHTQALQNLRRDRYAVPEETLSLARQAVDALDSELSPEFPMVQFLYGFVLLFHDSIEAAERELGVALAQADRAGETGHQARILTYVTLIARRRGEVAATEQHADRSAQVSQQSGMREYLAAAWANQAWVALRQGDLEGARSQAEKAWAMWRELGGVFPFCWMALLPLLEVDLQDGAIERAVSHARAMLTPDQHALPVSGVQPLTRAVEAWDRGKTVEAVLLLQSAQRALQSAQYS